MDLAASLGPLQFVLLGLIAFVAAIIGGISSFGASLLLTPFLVPVVGIKGVVPILSVAMLFGNSSRIWVYRHEIALRPILQILIPALPAVALGAWFNDLLPHDAFALVLGTFLLATIPLRRYLAHRQIAPTPVAIVAGSLVFGLISGAMPGGGVVLLPMLLGLGLTGGGLVGTDAAIGVTVNIAKVLLFGAFALLDTRLFIGGVLIGLCMIPGAYGAHWLIHRLNMTMHTALIELLIVFSGGSFIWSALFGS